ncbi:hypothetical protein JCM10212_006447 [Sporobolomyces blumeae]
MAPSPSPPGSSSSSLPLPSEPRRRPSLQPLAPTTARDGEPILADVCSPRSETGNVQTAGPHRPRSRGGSSSALLETPATPPKVRRNNSKRLSSAPTADNLASSSTASPPQPGTFLTRFLGSFRPPSTSQSRPPLPRSLSSPIKLAREVVGSSAAPSTKASPRALPQASASTSDLSTVDSNATLSKRLRPGFGRSRSQASASPTQSPTVSPLTSPGLVSDPARLSPGSPATLRGKERDPMDLAMLGDNFGANPAGTDGSSGSTSRTEGRGISRRESMLSQRTLLAHDRSSTAGSLSGGIPLSSPLRPIEEPQPPLPTPHLDQSLQLIATLLPPALILLSQLGPTHLFSPPMKIPSLFEVALGGTSSRKSSISGATDSVNRSDLINSDRASIASTATGDTTTTSASFLPALLAADHLRPTTSHELYAPSALSVPAVSAAAIWRLFRGFEWIGEVGKGDQPRPPSPNPDEKTGASSLDCEDEPGEIFDFPAMIQGVSDVLAADAAARGIELVIGQVGNGSAPSPAATPVSEGKVTEAIGGPSARKVKDVESRELIVRADERAWSVALVWILHHIIAGASSGSTIEVRFLATANAAACEASAASSQTSSSGSTSDAASIDPPTFPPRKWWTVSLEILHTAAPPTPAHPYENNDLSSPGAAPHLAAPPFDSPFAKTLFSDVGFDFGPVESGNSVESASKSWVLEGVLPSARPKPRPVQEPMSLLGRRRASLESNIGEEPSMGDLKRFADSALKGHRVALHASDQSTFAKHLTMYLAGWGMDVQHVPLDADGPLSSGSSSHGHDSKRPSVASRFDSGFAGTDTGTPPGMGFTPSSASEGSHRSSGDSGSTSGEPNSSLVIIDDDVSTLRRLLVSLRAPPLHMAPSLIAKRPQLATRRARSSPHVRQIHQLQHSAPSQWVIVHFASLSHYKTIKEIVADALATSRSPTLPEVLVIPKPAGPRRIVTCLWTALKRPAVDPFLPPIATSPTSPGIQYWTPRLSPALAKEQEFDFGFDGSTNKSNEGGLGAPFGKPRTPPTYFSPASVGFPSTGHLPPSPLGQNSENRDSYFSSVAEELKEATPSEGMVIQSPDGRSGIFFQPQTRATRSGSGKEKASSRPMERDRAVEMRDHGARELSSDPTAPPSRVATATPHEIGLGSSSARRKSSGSSNHHSDPAGLQMPLGTPALHLDSFISAAKSRANGEDVSPEELPPPDDPLRPPSSGSTGKRPSASARHSNSSGGSGNNTTAPSPRGSSSNSPNTFDPLRRAASGALSPVGSVPPATPLPPAVQGAAAAAKAASARAPTSPSSPRHAPTRSRTGTITGAGVPKGKRRASRKSTLPSVPPIRVLIVEDNKINQTILSVFMKKRGIKCEVAVDGAQAVDKWKKGNFHLVLMDIQLPVKDGIEATREIRELERQNNVGTFITTPTSDLNSPVSSIGNPLSTPSSPLLHMPVIIVALTASSLQADRVNALAAGCNDFLTKPVSLPWLETKLVEWGSMAYLSGFSRKPDASDPTTVSAPNNLQVARHLPQSTTPPPPGFSEGLASKADEVRGHLHIDRGHRPDSPASSPEATSTNASPALAAGPGVHPPTNTVEPSRPDNPALMLTSPTPQQTPIAKPVESHPKQVAQNNAEAGRTLDRVEEKLEELVKDERKSVPHRPGPTPLAPKAVSNEPSLDSVLAEGVRLAEFGRVRSGSTSFGQALTDSGVSSAAGSDESLRRKPPTVPEE